MKPHNIIIIAIAITVGLFGCANVNDDEEMEQNDPALDTIDIHPDTLNTFPVPIPDSALISNDTIVYYHPPGPDAPGDNHAIRPA